MLREKGKMRQNSNKRNCLVKQSIVQGPSHLSTQVSGAKNSDGPDDDRSETDPDHKLTGQHIKR